MNTGTTSTKVALVTGASRGIGRAIACRLAADGFAVAINYAGQEAAARQVQAEIEAAGGQARILQGDISDPAAVAALFDEVEATWGGLDVVVNSAGIMPLAPVQESSLADFDRVMAVNLRGAFLVLAQAAARVRNGGRILALSTSVIGKSFPAYGPYIASKAGVEGLVRVLANELRGRSVTVNAVAPGPVGTELFLDGKTPEQIAALSKVPPLERLGTPEDIASVVAFLCGPEGGWINAQVVRANGGFV